MKNPQSENQLPKTGVEKKNPLAHCSENSTYRND